MSMQLRSGRRYSPYRPVVAAVGRTVAQYAARSVGRYIANRVTGGGTQSASQTQTWGNGVTSQFDRRVQYRRKPMPKRRKRRWRKFKKRVNYVIDSALGTRSIIRNGSQTQSITDGSGNQTYLEATLYGIKGSGLHDDVYKIFQTFGTDDQLRGRLIRFKSAVLDITVVNKSAESQGAEVDVYEYYVRKSFPEADVGTLLDGVLADAVTPVMSAMVTFNKETRGFTPFQAPAALKYIKIKKKTKYFLASGQTFTYQIRDARNRVFNGEYVNDSQPFRGGWTKGLLITGKAVAGGTGNVSLAMGITKTYCCTFLMQNDANKGKI